MKIPPFLIPLVALVPSVNAALVVDDFDGLTTGGLSGKVITGTGFQPYPGSGNQGKWNGSASPLVNTSKSLSSTLYNVTQSGSNSIKGGNTDMRQTFGTLASPMAGEVWFSFLVETSQVDVAGVSRWSAAGLTLNSPTITPFADRGNFYVQMSGGMLDYKFGTNNTAGSVSIYSDAELGLTTTLIVGRFVLGGTGANDSIDLWVNPNLMADANILGIPTAYSSADVDGLTAIDHIGIVHSKTSSSNTLEHALLDSIRMSNNEQAFLEITGVPEPSAAMLLFGAVPSCLFIRRRRI